MATISTVDTSSPNHAAGAVVAQAKPIRAQPGNRTLIPVIDDAAATAGGTTAHPILG